MSHEIRTLQPGEKIFENGFYAIPLEQHHDQPCDGVAVTSGVLRTMELATPADVWSFHKLNPDRWARPETDALRLGRAMAAYVEAGMEGVKRAYLILPDDKPRRPTAQQIKAYEAGEATATGCASVEFWREVEADPRDPLTESEINLIADMGKALVLDPGAAAAMGGIPEVTMAWWDDETSLWVLARPDTVSFDGSTADFKKISTQGRPLTGAMLDRRIEQHGYHQQMALACEAMERLTGNWPEIVSLVFQTDKPPHHVVLREIGRDALEWGRFQNRRALRRFRECLDSGLWPGPGEHVGSYQMSEWVQKRMLEEMGAGA